MTCVHLWHIGQRLGRALRRTVLQVEVVGRPGRPQPHGVHRVVHVPWDGRVIGHGQDHLQAETQVNTPETGTVSFNKCTLCKSLWIKVSAKCPKCKCTVHLRQVQYT